MHKLYGVLAEAIVRNAAEDWPHPQRPRMEQLGAPAPRRLLAGTPIAGHAVGVFERACAILVRLGLAEAVDERGIKITGTSSGDRQASTCRLAFDADDVEDFVIRQLPSGRVPPIDEVLAIWIGCAAQLDLVRTTRAPFVPRDEARKVIRELVRMEYAGEIGSCIVWTDRMAPAMRLASFWNAEGRSGEDVEAVSVDDDIRAALRSLPEDVYDAARRNSVLEVQIALCNRWIDGAWKPPLHPDAQLQLFGGNARALRLIQLVAGRES